MPRSRSRARPGRPRRLPRSRPSSAGATRSESRRIHVNQAPGSAILEPRVPAAGATCRPSAETHEAEERAIPHQPRDNETCHAPCRACVRGSSVDDNARNGGATAADASPPPARRSHDRSQREHTHHDRGDRVERGPRPCEDREPSLRVADERRGNLSTTAARRQPAAHSASGVRFSRCRTAYPGPAESTSRVSGSRTRPPSLPLHPTDGSAPGRAAGLRSCTGLRGTDAAAARLADSSPTLGRGRARAPRAHPRCRSSETSRRPNRQSRSPRGPSSETRSAARRAAR